MDCSQNGKDSPVRTIFDFQKMKSELVEDIQTNSIMVKPAKFANVTSENQHLTKIGCHTPIRSQDAIVSDDSDCNKGDTKPEKMTTKQRSCKELEFPVEYGNGQHPQKRYRPFTSTGYGHTSSEQQIYCNREIKVERSASTMLARSISIAKTKRRHCPMSARTVIGDNREQPRFNFNIPGRTTSPTISYSSIDTIVVGDDIDGGDTMTLKNSEEMESREMSQQSSASFVEEFHIENSSDEADKVRPGTARNNWRADEDILNPSSNPLLQLTSEANIANKATIWESQETNSQSKGMIENFFKADPASYTLSSELKRHLEDKMKLTSAFYKMEEGEGEMITSVTCNDILDQLNEFSLHPVAVGFVLKCRVTRDRKGVDRGMYPTYYMHLERDDGRKMLIMAGRKRKKSATSNYVITTDPTDLSKNGSGVIGKVRSNLLGTQFSVYDNSVSYKRLPPLPSDTIEKLGVNINFRQELCSVLYEHNVLGFKGPRKMSIVIPAMLNEGTRKEIRPELEYETLTERLKVEAMSNLFILKNKTPIWNADNQSYVLNFGGRVTLASVKNFQIVTTELKEEYIILQFGRISEDSFTLDFRYPLCPMQAFAIALTSFDTKLACE